MSHSNNDPTPELTPETRTTDIATPDTATPDTATPEESTANVQEHKPRPRVGGRSGARSARRRSRELAMQGLYQWLLSGEDSGVIHAHIEKSPGFDRADRAHFDALLHGVIREAAEIDRLILPCIDRELNHLSPVERATLMIGCYELLRHQEIPYRVVINEAVELAKSFGGTDGYKYVNGVLDKLAGTIRSAEAGSGSR